MPARSAPRTSRSRLSPTKATSPAGMPSAFSAAWKIRGLGFPAGKDKTILLDLSGVFAPRGTPRAIIKTWHATIQKVLAAPDVKQLYAVQGLVPRGSASPEAFGKFIRSDYDRVVKLVKIAGVKPE